MNRFAFASLPPLARWLIFSSVTGILLILLVSQQLSFIWVVALSLLVAGVAEAPKLGERLRRFFAALRHMRQHTPYPDNPAHSERISPALWAAEIGFIVLVALSVTEHFRVFDTGLQLAGGEAEWLTSSAYFASNSLRQYGYIPLWQPYFEWGEPLIDNPFAFVLNPISTLPSLLYGGVQGIKYSVVLYTVLAGTGGWFLARVLGLGTVGRVLLGLLLIGKGNMVAMIGTGYFQLGVTQAYFGWIIGSAVLLLRAERRWAVALLAIMFTLMFWAGNIWYMLPMLVSVALLTLAHLVDFGGRVFNGPALRRMLLALALTVGLSAITLLPIFTHRHMIGGHPDEPEAGQVVLLEFAIRQYFDGDLTPYEQRQTPGGIQFYYSYVLPVWFAGLLFVAIPPIFPFTYRPGIAQARRVWLVGVVMILFCTSWGTGGNSVLVWLYDHVPLLGQWRFVGRALAVSAFWIAVLAAMRVDGLWRALVGTQPAWDFWRLTLRYPLAVLLALASLLAGSQVNARWREITPLIPLNSYDPVCIDWLRQKYPDEELTVYRFGYSVITTFIDNRVREFDIEADYFPIAVPSTISNVNLVGYNSLPRFALAWLDDTRLFLLSEGYRALPDSPLFVDHHCVWEKDDALPYAYSLPLPRLLQQWESVPVEYVTPLTGFDRKPDEIMVWAQADPRFPVIVTLQELAYPGWRVELDGEAAKLEVVGGQIGIRLPLSEAIHEIRFSFRPPLVYHGGAMTLGTGLFCALYLLRAERLVKRRFWRGV